LTSADSFYFFLFFYSFICSIKINMHEMLILMLIEQNHQWKLNSLIIEILLKHSSNEKGFKLFTAHFRYSFCCFITELKWSCMNSSDRSWKINNKYWLYESKRWKVFILKVFYNYLIRIEILQNFDERYKYCLWLFLYSIFIILTTN
jgi:hypothetical protein